MERVLERQNSVSLVEETLSDRSKAYNVRLYPMLDTSTGDWPDPVTIGCMDKASAIEVFALLSNDAKVAWIQ